MIKNIGLVVVFLLFSASGLVADEDSISDIYSRAGIEGELLIESLDKETIYQYSSIPVEQTFIPASTFKVPNTLIALEESVIKDQFEVIHWDGVTRAYAPWNSDQTLATAFARSCVWCYQYMARLIGDEKYRHYLDKFSYGNEKTGTDIATFWLDGDLRISTSGQVEFLRKVYLESLPVKKRNIEILKDIMLNDVTPHYKLWGKTGWEGQHGWYVGYLESNNRVWFFANYITIENQSDLLLRKKLVMDSLKLKGIF